MRKSFMIFFTVVMGLCLVLGVLPKVYAQETKSDEFTLEEIIVTAEKREVNVQKTAMAIAAISGEDISSKSISNVSEVLDNLAAVKVMGGPMGGNIFIRGIGSGIDTNMASPSVALQKDNVYLGQSEAVLGSLYDIDRVEVLYGPQGTMYGRNAAGGQVNVITKNPSDKFEAAGNMSLGTYNLTSYSASLNVPLSSAWAARLALDQQTHDGYVSDGSSSANKFASRLKLSYKPNDNVSLLFTTEFTFDKSSNMNTVPVPGSAGKLGATPGGPPGSAWADPSIATDGWVIPYGGDAWTNDIWHPAPKNNTRYQLFSIQANLDMGFTKLTLIPTLNRNYRDLWSNLITGTSDGGTLNQQKFREKQYSAELRLSNGDDSPFIWTLGTYWYKSDNKNPDEATADPLATAQAIWDTGNRPAGAGGPPGPPLNLPVHTQDYPLISNPKLPQDSLAAFGQVTYPVSDRFRVVGGIRWNKDNNNMKVRIIIMDVSQNGDIATKHPEYYTNSVVTTDGRHYYDSGYFKYTLNSSPLTYKGGLEYDLSPNKMLYLNVTTGFKAGGLNTEGTFPPVPFDPEEVVNYSIGAKTRFMDNQLQLNAEAYYYDYTGYQVQLHGDVPYTNGLTGKTANSGNMMGNAKKGTNSGIEISPTWMVTANDMITATFAYMKTEIGELLLPKQGPAPAMDLTGTDLPKAPHFSGTLGYSHTFNLEDGGTVTPKFETKISAGFWNTIEKNLAGSYTDGYTMSDLYLTYANASGKFSASLWVKNLENSEVTDYAFPNYRRIIMNPRTSGLTFSAKF